MITDISNGLFTLRSRHSLVLIVVVHFFSVYANSQLQHKRFEYKYSFKPPYLAQKDGSVPFWEYGGNAIASAENVRVAPSLRSQKGAIWTKNTLAFDNWEVDLSFRISGRGRIGADGLAFWYTQHKGTYDGNVFGSSDKWVGLAVFFDSFDNDNKHNNPYIMAMLNDGTKEFDHQSDGKEQMLAGCLRDFRNKPFPTRARIQYVNNVLSLEFHAGMTNQEDFEVCFRAENVFLPKNGYFGVSAATGGLADDHDIIHFLTSSFSSQQQQQQGGHEQQQISEEQAKLEREYSEYDMKLQKQKEEFRKEHPSEVKEPDMDDWFESDSQRELRQIFQGQSLIQSILKRINDQLEHIGQAQQNAISMMSQMAQGGQVQQLPQGQTAPPASGFVDTIRRDEVNAVLNNQNTIMNAHRELRQFVLEVKQRSDQIINNQAKAPTAQVQAVGYDTQAVIAEMRDGLNHMKQQSQLLLQRINEKPECSSGGGVSLTMFLVAIVTHLLIVLGYSIYRDNKESQAKKFY